jgi:hypothetical protein
MIALVLAPQVAAGPRSSTLACCHGSFRAVLTVGQELKKPQWKGPAPSARFTGTLSGGRLSWSLVFYNLTSTPVGARITPSAGASSSGLILCTVKTGGCDYPEAEGPDPLSGTITATTSVDKAMIDSLVANKMYFNISTPHNPAGELRGRIVRVA